MAVKSDWDWDMAKESFDVEFGGLVWGSVLLGSDSFKKVLLFLKLMVKMVNSVDLELLYP